MIFYGRRNRCQIGGRRISSQIQLGTDRQAAFLTNVTRNISPGDTVFLPNSYPFASVPLCNP